MSKICREKADPQKHKDFMNSFDIGGENIKKSKDNLIKKWVYFARIDKFTFSFVSLEQVRECKEYFEQKIHPSTASYHPPFEHYWQPWWCRLPKGINKENKRKKVLKALDEILEKWG